MIPIERILSGRDGRAWLQRLMIGRSGLVIQVSLNIPGFPKNLGNDRILVEKTAKFLKLKAISIGYSPLWTVLLDNGAGPAELIEIQGGEGEPLKLMGMEMEDLTWGSILDIDVIGLRGAIHRKDVGGGDRKCMICDAPAKLCAREQRHDYGILRNRSALLVALGLEEMGEF